MASTNIRRVALVYTKSLTRPSCDRAIDLDAEDQTALKRALSDYARSRSDEDLAKIPVRDGQALTLWGVKRLSRQARKWVDDAVSGTDRVQRAVQCGLVTLKRPDDADEKRYRLTKVGGVSDVMSEADLDTVYDAVGQAGLDELASVILALSEAGEEDLAPFAPPPGLMLAR